jgi:uncharacterized protein YecT (DUF1311 family)
MVALALAAVRPDCPSLYSGLEGAPDLPAALACFRANGNWAMVAVMLLDGEGAAVDVAGARAAYQHLLDENGHARDDDAVAMEKILRQRESHPGDARRIDFCREVARTTYSLDLCAAIGDRADERRTRETIAKTRAALAPGQQSLLDELAAAASRLIEADGQRLYQQYIDGSIRTLASYSQRQRVRKTFVDRLQSWGSPAATLTARRSLDDADRELNAVYRKTLAASDASDYQSKVREAQRAWLRYRDAFAKFVSARQPPAASPAIRRLVRSLLTKDRIDELRRDAVAPQ